MASWPPLGERVFLGKSIRRLDGPDKAQGRAKYAYDVARPGMLYARILGSPHAHARVTSVDVSAAQKLNGVRAVIVLKDPAQPESSSVLYAGEEIAAVAAITEEIAEDALRLIKVDYEVLPHLATVEQAMRSVGSADDNAFAEFLINEAGVAVVPGSAFGAPGHIRLSFAATTETLKDALARMERALAGSLAKRRA